MNTSSKSNKIWAKIKLILLLVQCLVRLWETHWDRIVNSEINHLMTRINN